MKRALSIFCALFAASLAYAADNHTSAYYEISGIIIHSKDDTVYPSWAGLTQVAFAAPLVWATPNVCNSNVVVVRVTDTHVMAAIHAARAQDKPVRLYVDDSQRQDGTYCILRAVQY